MSGPRTAIVGAGRMGQGIGLALAAAGWDVTMLARTAKPVPPPLRLLTGAIPGEVLRQTPLLLIATPDDRIGPAAATLAESGGLGPDHTVLHLSGLLDRSALAPLTRTGAALGSFHPLQTIAEPATAPDRLRGAFAGIEGDAGALAAGQRIAAALGMTAVPLDAELVAEDHVAKLDGMWEEGFFLQFFESGGGVVVIHINLLLRAPAKGEWRNDCTHLQREKERG